MFNCREGFRRKDDDLPYRIKYDPITTGPTKGKTISQEALDEMLNHYYRLRGWDSNGIPKQATLQALGIASEKISTC